MGSIFDTANERKPYIITYNISSTFSQAEIVPRIMDFGNWWRLGECTWVIMSEKSAEDIMAILSKDFQCKIFVSQITRNTSALGLSKQENDWLKTHVLNNEIMNDEYDKSFRKFAMLSKAIQLANDEPDEEDPDGFPRKGKHGCTIDPLLEDLKAAAFEVLLLNPGSEYDDWEQELIRNYHTEVIDCYGNNPYEVYPALRDLWEDEYDDPASGMCMDFDEWARAFATDEAREVYYRLVEVVNKGRNSANMPQTRF